MNRLKQLRKEAGLTQEELANNLNISTITLLRYEKEQREPTKKIALLIANFFDVSTDYLFGLNIEDNRDGMIQITKLEYERLKAIEQKYNEIKSLVAD